jgi:transcriptional regulator with XRE-family HTH domain
MEQENVLFDEGMTMLSVPIASIQPYHFIALIHHILEKDHITHRQLANTTGMSESKISRFLNNPKTHDILTLNRVCTAIGLDIMRAILAVGRFGDWRQYFDPDVEIIADLIEVLPPRLVQARTGNERATISHAGTVILADKLSEMIATNDRETSRRRRERPIAGL